MKGLPPALRRKKRYIAFKIIRNNSKKIESKDLIHTIWHTTLSLLGELHGNAGLRLEYFNGEYGILRCSRDKLEAIIATLTLISNVSGEKVAIKTLGVSGTIKGCRKFLNNTRLKSEISKDKDEKSD